MLAVIVAAAGAALFAASGFAIYKTSAQEQPLLTYYAYFFLPGPIAIAISMACGVNIAVSAGALALGALLFAGNLCLSWSYEVGARFATAIALGLVSVLAVVFSAAVLRDEINAREWLAVSLLIVATFMSAGFSEKQRATKSQLIWILLVSATCVLLASRAVLISWELSIVDDALSLILLAYGTAALLAVGSSTLLFLGKSGGARSPTIRSAAAAFGAGLLSLLGLACFGYAVATGEVIVSNAVFGIYPVLTLAAIAMDSGGIRHATKLAPVALTITGLVILAVRNVFPH